GDAIERNGHLAQFEFVASLNLQDKRFAGRGVDADDTRCGPSADGELALGGVMKDDHPLHHPHGFAEAVAVWMPAFRQNSEFAPETGRVSAEQTLRLGWRDC